VFQNYALFPHLTIYDNVAFGLRRRKVADVEVKRRVPEMLELVQLRGFERRKPGQISGGQAQRVALARALINRPAVLLLDEPLGALDLKLRKQMQVELKRIQQEVGITFIYVTHDQEEAMTMSDRVAVMNRGRYEQLAPPAELYERPATRFVAGFLGASNLLRGRAEGADGELATVRLKTGEAVRMATALLGTRRDVDIGVRPEKIRMLEMSETAPVGANLLTGTVTSALYTGVSTQYQVALPSGTTVVVYEQNLERARAATQWRPGEEAQLAWSPNDTFAVDLPANTDATDDEMLGMASAVPAAAP
jgi:spermidine/putrescine transport system ATP-binding protein